VDVSHGYMMQLKIKIQKRKRWMKRQKRKKRKKRQKRKKRKKRQKRKRWMKIQVLGLNIKAMTSKIKEMCIA